MKLDRVARGFINEMRVTKNNLDLKLVLDAHAYIFGAVKAEIVWVEYKKEEKEKCE